MQSTSSILQDFSKKKKESSPFLQLKSGESLKIFKVRHIGTITKESFGTIKEMIHMVFDVETPMGIVQKTFDQGSMRWCEELSKNQIDVGSSFTITREGEGVKTRYLITEVTNPTKPAVQTSISSTSPTSSIPPTISAKISTP